MKRERAARNSVHIAHSSTGAGVVSAGDHTRNTVTIGGAAKPAGSVDELRGRLLAERAGIEGAVADPEERQEVAEAINRILHELNGDRPAPARVRRRWKVVRDVLAGVATASAAVATVVDDLTAMIAGLFPAS